MVAAGQAVSIGVMLLVAAVLGFTIYDISTSEEMEEYTEKSEQWCDERNGELANVQSVLHGGLHCDLPNGTSVHMHKVIET